jgi:hypothetical protein
MASTEQGDDVTQAKPERRPGVMIAMFDIPESLDEEFNSWYDDEHIPEKVGNVPGFLRARRYRSLEGRPNYLCIYELEDLSVLDNPTYTGNYSSGTSNTVRMKSKATTFYRNVYYEIADVEGIPLDGEV